VSDVALEVTIWYIPRPLVNTRTQPEGGLLMTRGAIKRSVPATDGPGGLFFFLRLVLPFAAGHFLSYFFRTANAVIGPSLRQELSLSAGGIGLLTGAYFLTYALVQIPLGVLLDRVGGRRVEAVLLLVAAAGSAAFASGRSLGELAAARALIGLGVSACLMAAFKAFSQWFEPGRLASLTGWMMAAGGLGAIVATAPLQTAVQLAGWRVVFLGLAAMSIATSAWIYFGVPEVRQEKVKGPPPAQWSGVVTVFRSRQFWQLGPLALTVTGGFFAVQGLWSASWLVEVSGLSRRAAADELGAMNLAMLVTFGAIGLFATRLAKWGMKPAHLLGAGIALALTTLVLIITGATSSVRALWVAYGSFSCFGTLVFAIASQGFPPALVGRANTALNVMIFSGAFGIQWGLGAAIDALVATGFGVAAAHRAAFIGLLGVQAMAYAWFLLAGWLSNRAAAQA
jgi:predicted MFS family arabinose efflux permease